MAWATGMLANTRGSWRQRDADALHLDPVLLSMWEEHQDFHEQCVEKIFVDIMARCQPTELSIYGRYMRRGGLDINPYRSTVNRSANPFRQVRQ